MDSCSKAVLVSLTLAGLEDMLGKLDFSRVELVALMTDSSEDIDVRIGGRRISFYSFAELDILVQELLFATGISYMMAGLSVDDMPLGFGVNLAASSQDIYYSLEIAKRVLLQNPKVRYAFIGLSPYSFSYSLRDSFSTSSMSTIYELMWNSGGRISLQSHLSSHRYSLSSWTMSVCMNLLQH